MGFSDKTFCILSPLAGSGGRGAPGARFPHGRRPIILLCGSRERGAPNPQFSIFKA